MRKQTFGRGWLHWRVEGAGPVDDARPDHQPRLVLECPDGSQPATLAHTLANAGFDVTVCSGPSRASRCAMLDDGQCVLIDQADIVVNALELADLDGLQILATTLATTEVPVIIACPGHEPEPDASRSDAGSSQEVASVFDSMPSRRATAT